MAKRDGELVREIKNATIRLSGSHAARFGLSGSCEQEAVRQLGELRARVADEMSRDGQLAAADFFYAEQNAHLRPRSASASPPTQAP